MVVDVIGVLAILLDPNHFREVYGGWWLARTAQTPICAVCTSHRMFETGIEIGAVRASSVISHLGVFTCQPLDTCTRKHRYDGKT